MTRNLTLPPCNPVALADRVSRPETTVRFVIHWWYRTDSGEQTMLVLRADRTMLRSLEHITEISWDHQHNSLTLIIERIGR